MKKKTRIIPLAAFGFGIIFSTTVSAYGGGGSAAQPCKPPKFKKFKPPASSVVEPRSAFSFIASPDTRPVTIKVEVKKIKVDVDIEEQLDGKYRVRGTLPDSLQGTYAKIKVVAKASNCTGSAGWLIKIAEENPAPAEPEDVEQQESNESEEATSG